MQKVHKVCYLLKVHCLTRQTCATKKINIPRKCNTNTFERFAFLNTHLWESNFHVSKELRLSKANSPQPSIFEKKHNTEASPDHRRAIKTHPIIREGSAESADTSPSMQWVEVLLTVDQPLITRTYERRIDLMHALIAVPVSLLE